jgi:hypothetical protein
LLSIGTTLREERLRRGLSVDEVAAGTRIRARYLVAIEDERFADLPGSAYAPVFIGTYARHLGLDPHPLTRAYRDNVIGAEEAAPEEVPATRSAPPLPRLPGPSRRTLGRVVLALCGIAVIAVVAWLVVRGGGGGGAPATPPAEPTVAVHPPRARPAPVREAAVWRFVGRGPVGTYLEVRTGSHAGPLLWRGHLASGGRVRAPAAGTLWVRIGNPAGVRLRLGTRTTALPPGGPNYRLRVGRASPDAAASP